MKIFLQERLCYNDEDYVEDAVLFHTFVLFLRVISRYTDENNLVLSFEKLFNWRRAEWGYEN